MVIMPWPQTPGSSAALAIPHSKIPPSSSCTLSTSQRVSFGAQSLHLRYGLITPIYQLHPVGHPPECVIGARPVANLCLIRTLTGKNYQALLGARKT